MKPERWRQVDLVFAAALELPESERPDFLNRVSGSDHALREEVEALLEADGQFGILLDEPIARLPQDAAGSVASLSRTRDLIDRRNRLRV